MVPRCACENWVHMECSYGIPEGRLRAAHCQTLDPLRGVVVTDFNSGKDELRCLVPWRPWVKKFKKEWWSGKGAGKGRHMRDMHEMLPTRALEKHAWLGAGLMWKRIGDLPLECGSHRRMKGHSQGHMLHGRLYCLFRYGTHCACNPLIGTLRAQWRPCADAPQ